VTLNVAQSQVKVHLGVLR